jgi:D-3-phosphoglycerate dehydrogenase
MEDRKTALFVDCRPDIAPALTTEHRAIVPCLEIHFGSPATSEALVPLMRPYQAVLVYMAYLSEEVFVGCPDLQSVTYLSTGLDTHIDLAAAERRGIRVRGVKGYGDRAVAEHVMALLFAAVRRLIEADRRVRAGRWELMATSELAGRTLGIVGTGAIGSEVVCIAAALGMRVLAWNYDGVDPSLPCESTSLERLFSQSDAASIHLPLNEETRGMIGSALLATMKPGAILINTARAELIDEAALLEALRDGPLGHAALDVFHHEPLPLDSPLFELENITLTPHSAWFTSEAVERLLKIGLETLSEEIERLGGSQ